MKNYVEEKVVVITGGSSGFGLETARMLLELGAKVVITGRSQQRLDIATASLHPQIEQNNQFFAIQADATKSQDWQKVVWLVVEKWGRIDVLVNNHGAGVKIAPTEEMSDDQIADILDLNLGSVIKGAREVIPVMRQNGSGHIINVASACASRGWANWGVYSAAKGGLVAFTKCLHKEMSEWGGKASNFIPAAAATNFCNASNLDGSWLEGYPTAEDFARTIVHLVDLPDSCVMEEVKIWGTKQISDSLNPY